MSLEIKNLYFKYKDKNIFNNISLKIEKNKTTCIMGSSGIGKTTLFNLITGIIKPLKGEIKINNSFSYLMQNNLLLPWKTIIENVLMLCNSKNKAKNILEKVGLKDYLNSFPHQLSKGMQKRASLARSLILEAPLLLLDEPLSNIDNLQKQNLYNILKNIKNTTILIITHDLLEAKTISDTIYSIQSNSGVINLK